MPSLLLYAGLLLALLGCAGALKPRLLRLEGRRPALRIALSGAVVALAAAVLPAPLRRVETPSGKLDEILPAYQFREFHERWVGAAPEPVFRAIRGVTAPEVRFFRLLTWLRAPRLGRGDREDILHAPAAKPILDVALASGFLLLAEDPGRELVIGTLLGPPLPPGEEPRPEQYAAFDRPGYAKAVMNFRVIAEAGGGGCRVTTETRVLATDPAARRRFALYWRIIYPGSALIRRMWLAAIERRAEAEG